MSEGALFASVVSAACFLRRASLFFRAAPKTPLRVLGIVAFDTLHVLRHARWLPRERSAHLVMFFDFAGFTNAALDGKELCETDYHSLRERMGCAGLDRPVENYLTRLRALEADRPTPGGDRRGFEEVRAYREAVARLSLTTAAGMAFPPPSSSDEEIAADADLDTLLRILMQCQIIDDVLDYRVDATAGLPSFMTACASLPEAVALTAAAAARYASPPRTRASFPLRFVLRVITILTRLVIGVARPRPRNARQFAR